MPRDRADRTYRVRRIPSHVSIDTLADLLCETCKALGESDNIIVFSLTSSLVPFEAPRTKTATVGFKKLPAIFDNDEDEWMIPTAAGQPNIIVDTHFLGFTALNDADSDLHTLDGLASHPFGSWANRKSQSHFMWLRDQLPHDIKQVRSIIYGYDTRLIRSQSFQTLQDIALSLIAQLKLIGRALKSAKPIVFLAHSLGGILLKYALLEMANSGEEERFMLRLIQQVILFGVPNKGMEMEHWLPMVEGQPNEPLIRLLAPGSPELIDLDERFMGIAKHYELRITSFFETGRSKTAVRNASTNGWELSGPYKVLVERGSAIQSGSQESDIIPINQSHSEMVKFRENAVEYQLVAVRIHDLVTVVRDQLGIHVLVENELHFPSIPKDLSLSSDDSIDRELVNKIVQSLDIEDTEYRFKKIEDAYGSTFEWVWTAPDIGLSSWLKQGHGIYWINGKPGSGKSTLMKYIFKHYDERREPRAYNSDTIHLYAGFFFYDRGSHIQKSFEGLLFSILHQILHLEPMLAKEVSPIYHRISRKRNHIQWSADDLEEALNSILNQTTLYVDILLFLDALDEYGGRPEFIASFVKRLVDPTRNSATEIRLCFSSRPWNIFTDQFQTCPGFKVHEHTEQDIISYIQGTFSETPGIASLKDTDNENGCSRFELLVSGLLKGAEGVFLWLKLVMEDLKNECTDGATLTELLCILSSFPSELEDLYTRIVQRIPKNFRKESYAMLEIVLRSGVPVSPYDFWLAVACAPCKTLDECVAKIPLKLYIAAYQVRSVKHEDRIEMESRFDMEYKSPIGVTEQQKRRIKSRCGGLIELVPHTLSSGESGGHILQFMHQTVKDFVSKPGFRQLFEDEIGDSKENGYSFLSKYGLAQLVVERRRCSFPPNDKPPSIFVLGLPKWLSYLHYSSRAESSTGMSQKTLLDSAEEAFAPDLDEDDMYSFIGSAMLFGVANNLKLYVEETLSTAGGEPLAKFLGNSGRDDLSLLHMAVLSATSTGDQFLLEGLLVGINRRVNYYHILDTADLGDNDLAQMANILFDHKANRDCVYHSMTPFQWVFQGCREGYYGGGSNTIPISVLNLTRTFLAHGQDPNTFIWNDFHYYGKAIKCQPLHVADSDLASVLLQYGASVNALDARGYTALDIAFGAVGNIYEIGDHASPEEGYKLTIVLLDWGGRVTDAGLVSLEHYLKAIVRYKPLDRLDKRIQNPPRL